MKKSNENKNLNFDRVEENLDNGKFIEFNEKVQKRPPQPLTREQLEYYHKAREQALKRKAKPISSADNMKNNSHQVYRKPVQSSNVSTKRLDEGHSNNSYNQSVPNYSNRTDNTFTKDVNSNSPQAKKNSKNEQAARRAEHLRKQAYYDSRYADDDEIVEYYGYSSQESNSGERKPRKNMYRLFRFISWLIFFLIFIIIGYFLAKLILS